MNDPVFSFIIEIVGAFIVWAFKGFKGKLSDEMSGPYESNKKGWRNALISFSLLFIIIALISNCNKTVNKDVDEKIYEISVEK